MKEGGRDGGEEEEEENHSFQSIMTTRIHGCAYI